MNTISEYRLQTLGGVLLVLGGVLHWVMMGTFLKFNGFITDPHNSLAPLIRQIGILAFLIPIGWAVFTIKKEREATSRWTRRHTILSGIVAAFVMFYLLGFSLKYGKTFQRVRGLRAACESPLPSGVPCLNRGLSAGLTS